MAEQWTSLEALQPPEPTVQNRKNDREAAFLSTIPSSKQQVNKDQAFLSEMPDAPNWVFLDPEKVKKAKIISSTLAMPFGPIFDNVDAASAAFDRHDPNWFKTAGSAVVGTIGSQMATAARAAEWAGLPAIAYRDLLETGTRLRDAYMPAMTPGEFTFDKVADPRWWATTAVSGVTSSLTLLPAAVVGAYGAVALAPATLGVFGTTVLGALGATALSRPIESAFEAAQSYEEAKAQGKNDAEAKARGNFVFQRNMVAGSALDVAEIVAAFTPLKLLGGAANKTLARRIAATIGKFGTAAALEGGEEAYQTGIQQMARGEQMNWSPEMKESAALGAIMGVGMGGAGSVWNALTGRMENKMPVNMKEEYQANELAAKALGKTDEEAKIIALDKFAESPGGKAFVEKEIGNMIDLVEGKETPITVGDMDSKINEIAEEKPFTMGDEPLPEPDPLEGILTDEDIQAIGEGTGTIESALGMEDVFTSDKESPEVSAEVMARGKAFLVSEETYQTALKNIKEKSTGFHAGIDPTVLKDLVQVAAYHIEKGIKTFAEFSKAMIDKIGEDIKPHLKDLWKKGQREIVRRSRNKNQGAGGMVKSEAEAHMTALEEGAGLGSKFTYQGEVYTGAERQGNNMLLKGEKDKLVRGAENILQIEEISPFEDAPEIGEKELNLLIGTDKPKRTTATQKKIKRTTGQERLVNMIREDDVLRAVFKKAEEASREAYAKGGEDAKEKAKAEFRNAMMTAKAAAEVKGYQEGFTVAQEITRKEFIEAFQESQAMTKATQKMLIGYIKENLPREVQGKFLDAIIGQVAEHKAFSVMGRVDAEQERLTRRELINEIKTLQEFKGQHIAVDYQKKINDLLGDIDTKKISRGTLMKLSSLIDFAESEGMPSGISATMKRNLERLSQVNANDMTTEDLQSLVDTANHLREMGKLKMQLRMKYNQREREKAKAALVASTRNIDPKTGKNSRQDTERNAATEFFHQTLTGWRVPELLDNYSDGANVELYKYAWDAEQGANWEKHEVVVNALEEIEALGIKELSDKDNIEIMINIRNKEMADSATLFLMEKYGYSEIPELSPQHEKLIEILKKYSSQFTDRVAAYYEERKNTPFVRLENRVLPLKYVNDSYTSAEEAILEDHHRTTQAQQGFTEQRKPGVQKEPRVDVLAVFELGIDEQSWYVHVQPTLDEISKLINSKEYVEAAGAAGANWWKDHLDIMARRGWSASAHYSKGGAWLKMARTNLTKAILGYKVSTIFMQPLAVFDAMSYAHGKWGGTTALEVLAEVSKSWIIPGRSKRTVEGSHKLTLRGGTGGEQSIVEAMASSKQSKFQRAALSMMTKADLKTAAGTQNAFENILKRKGVADAHHQAEMLMDMVSSSSDVSFRPHVLARGELARTWFTFGTFALNRWSIIMHDMINKGVRKGTPKAKFNAAMGLLIVIAGTIAENEARKYLYEMVSGKERKRRALIYDMIFALPQNIPLFGDVFAPFAGGAGADMPLTKVIGDLMGGSKAIIQGKPKAKVKGAFKAAEALITARYGVAGTSQAADIIERIFLPDSKSSSGSGRVELGPQ